MRVFENRFGISTQLPNLVILLICCGLAFWLGYSVNQGGTCSVATAQELLFKRRPRRFISLLATSAMAGLVTLAMFSSGHAGFGIANVASVAFGIIVGATIFGIGATINDACLFGSLGRLSDGELRLVFLPVGLITGFFIAEQRDFGLRPMLHPSVLTTDKEWWPAAANLYLAILFGSLAYLRKRSRTTRSRWSLGLSSVVLGATGGALYVSAPSWTYADLLQQSLPLAMPAASTVTLPTVVASLGGAFYSAHRRGSWHLRFGSITDVVQTFIGGVLMGIGASFIPGGNDGLILAAIPAFSPGGAAAYLLMTAVIMSCLALKKVGEDWVRKFIALRKHASRPSN